MSETPSPPIFVVTAAKGGAAKTTTAVNLAYAISQLDIGRPMKVLFFDLDAQGNATSLLGHVEAEFPEECSVKYVLEGKAAKPLSSFGIELVGYNAEAAGQFQLVANPLSMRTFMRGFQATVDQEKPDVVFIDTPPIETPAGGVATMVATHAVIPMQAHRHGLAGAIKARDYIEQFSVGFQKKLTVCGVVPVQVFRCKAIDQIIGKAVVEFGELMTESVPLRAVILEAGIVGSPVVPYERDRHTQLTDSDTFFDKQAAKKYDEIGRIFNKIAEQILNHAMKEAQ